MEANMGMLIKKIVIDALPLFYVANSGSVVLSATLEKVLKKYGVGIEEIDKWMTERTVEDPQLVTIMTNSTLLVCFKAVYNQKEFEDHLVKLVEAYLNE